MQLETFVNLILKITDKLRKLHDGYGVFGEVSFNDMGYEKTVNVEYRVSSINLDKLIEVKEMIDKYAEDFLSIDIKLAGDSSLVIEFVID